jgi:hypothetical protein
MSFKIIPTLPFEQRLKQQAKKYSSIKKVIMTFAEQLGATSQDRYTTRE